MKHREYGFLAIDMGLGKTRCVLEYIKETKCKALIVAPLQVMQFTWPNEIAKWTPELTYTVLHGAKKNEALLKKTQIYLINYDGIQWLFNTVANTTFLQGLTLILDESTMVKNRGTLRAKLIAKLRPQFSRCFLLSATPTPNGIWDWWSQFRIMDRGRCFGNWGQFSSRFLITNPYTHALSEQPNARNIVVQMVKDDVIRLKAEDYIDLPDYIINDIKLKLPEYLKEMYKSLLDDFILQLSTLDTITATSAGALGSKLRQFLQGAIYTDTGETKIIHQLKIDALEQIQEELAGTPNLVAINFKSELQQIKQRFGDVPVIAGGVNIKERNKILHKWNDGKIPMLVVHPGAISHGVNLQAGGHYITWLALSWSYEQYHQANGRLRRRGQQHPVVINRVLFEGTKDIQISRALEAKGSNQAAILHVLQT